MWGCSIVWQSVGTARCWLRFDSPVRQGIFLPVSTFSAESLTVSVHPRVQSHALKCVRTLKDLLVYVRVRWIMETLKHPACTVGWVARLCRSWLSPGGGEGGTQHEFLVGEIQMG